MPKKKEPIYSVCLHDKKTDTLFIVCTEDEKPIMMTKQEMQTVLGMHDTIKRLSK